MSKIIRDYYPNGSLEIEIKYNQSGDIHSGNSPAVIIYYQGRVKNESGSVMTEIWFKNGRLSAKREYHPDGSLAKEIKYNQNGQIDNGDDPAIIKYRPIDDQEDKLGKIINKGWFEDGVLLVERHYFANQSLKLEIKYDKNGQIHNQTDPAIIGYSEGDKDQTGAAVFKIWFNHGIKTLEKTYYKNGSPEEETKYNQAGQIDSSGSPAIVSYYRRRRQNKPGPIRAKTWVKSGVIKSKKEFWRNGSLKSALMLKPEEPNYYQDQPKYIEYTKGSKNKLGDVVSEVWLIDKVEVERTYYKNGLLEEETKYNQDGQVDCQQGPAWVKYFKKKSRVVETERWCRRGIMHLKKKLL